MAFRLFIARGNSQGQQFIAVQPMVFIGREAGCDVVLSDAGVSGRHVRITERDGRYFVEDLKSANGTTLNGSSLVKETEIFTGDSLGVGTAVVQLTLLEVPDLTQRKRVVPAGVAVSGKRETGDLAPLPKARAVSDDEATAPVGKPLAREELENLPGTSPASRGPEGRSAPSVHFAIDRSKYEADTDKTSPVAPVMAEPVVVMPRGSPPTSVMVDAIAPTQQASALFPVVSSTGGTVKDLGVVPERERDTGDEPAFRREHDTARQPELDALPPSEKGTALVPPLPAAAEAMTAIDAAVVEAPVLPTRSERSLSGMQSPPSVLVSASEVLRRVPEAANVETKIREPTVIDESTDPSGAARPDLPPPEGRASDRARRKRLAFATLGGQLRWYWEELSFRARVVIGSVVSAIAVGVLLALWLVFRPPPHRVLPDEPVQLGAKLTPYSFGLGDGVDYEHRDFKEFRFDLAAPTAVAVMVHYRAQDIGHEEVSISVNGNEAGFVPADSRLVDREIETLLSHFALKRDEPNALVFDNVRNPPGKEAWRVSDLWLELIPVPEVTAEHALQLAKEAYAKAEALEKQRASGDDTLFFIWRTYRAGWIALLPLREEKRGWMFADMRRKSEAARAELDVLCGTVMLDAKKQIELKNPEGAKEILEGVPRYFPTRDHPCQAVAEQKLREYDL